MWKGFGWKRMLAWGIVGFIRPIEKIIKMLSKPEIKKKRDKHLFILRFPPPFGGGEIVSKELFNELRDKGYLFLIITYKNHSKSKQNSENLSAFFRGIKYIFLSCSVLLFKHPRSVYLGIPKTFGAFSRTAIVILWSRLLNIKVFGEIHGMSFPFINTSNIKKKFLIFILNKTISIRVLSSSIKEYLTKIGYNGSIYVINNGITRPNGINLINQNILKEGFNILYLGAISEKKGFMRVLKIFAELPLNIRSKIKLNVIGEWVDKHEKKVCFSFIDKNNLIDKINFHGKKVDEGKWNLIRENQIMIHLTEFDGQPLTIIETMSLGIPTIATKVGGIPEMIENGKNGFLVDSDSEVIKILNDILINKIDLSVISKNAVKKYFSNFTPQSMAVSIEKMIQNYK